MSDFVRRHAIESLNFQISMTIYWIIALVLTFVLIGVLAVLAIGIFQVVVLILDLISASKGEMYRYPASMRFVKE